MRRCAAHAERGGNIGKSMDRNNERIEALRHEGGSLADEEYSECAFHRCDFSGLAMRNVKFINCVFEDCALRNITFQECSLLNGTFRRCSLVGLDWSTVRRHGARLPLLVEVRECSVKYNTFIDLGLAKAVFAGSALHECYFQDCALKQADFRNCDLLKTTFLNCDLSKADFRDARNYGINVLSNRVAKAKFSQPDVVGLLGGFDIIIEGNL